MRHAEPVERAGQAIGRLSRDPAPWPQVAGDVVAQLRRVVGFDAFCASQNDPRTPAPAGAVADSDAVGRRQRRFWQLEMRVRDVNKTAVLARAPIPVGVLSLATGGDLSRSARWRELLSPGGIGDELRIALVADNQWWGSIILYRERRAVRFTTGDAGRVARLVGPIASVARRSWTAAPTPSAVVRDRPGTIVVASDGRQLTLTPPAQRWLARLAPAQLANDALIHWLTVRLVPAADRHAGPDAVSTLVRGVDGGWIELVASRLEKPLGDGVVAITVQAAPPDAVTDLLLRAYDLTGRERQIACLALSGRSTAEIGAELFLSPFTVADHLKAVFTKTGVHSRAELTQRLTGLAP